MVRHARSRAHAHEFDIVEDHTATVTNHYASIDANVALISNPFALLDKHNNNTDRSPGRFIDSLTDKLKELHIYSPVKNRGDTSLRERSLTRSTTATEIFPPLQTDREDAERPRVTEEDEGDPSLAETHRLTAAVARQVPDSFDASFPYQVLRASRLEHHSLRNDSSIQSSIAQHEAGQYDYVLSVDGSASRNRSPNSAGELSQRYGCNLLVQRQYFPPFVCSQGKPANACRVLATPLRDGELVTQNASPILAPEENMAVAESVVRFISPAPVRNESALVKPRQSSVTAIVAKQAQPKPDEPKQRVISISSTDESNLQTPRTPSRLTPASSQQSRIEDSLEAIDKLEEQLELVDAAITPPSKSRPQQAVTAEFSSTNNPHHVRRTDSLLKRDQSSKTRVKSAYHQQRSAHSYSVAMATEESDAGSPAKTATKRSSVSRPSSLLPPKSPAKSTKLPTKPSFELPGEAVARRLREQREARQAAQEKATATATVPQRTRSLKAPTRPNFELPGERISRRKREEQQAKLKAEEEEQRRRREFKARPIRANLSSATYPRETATSRARQGKGTEPTDSEQVEQSSSKRSSVLGMLRTPLTRSKSARSPQSRGRGISQATNASEASRATSTSTSSVSGNRSTLSAEDLEQQKIKGREVFQRDSFYVEDKERERRERELNAKIAREQAAERSRQASREWADKQRRKQVAANNAAARQEA